MSTANSTTQKLVDQMRLPCFPSVALRVTELISQNSNEVAKLSRVINTDAPLSAALLRSANSALFTQRTRIDTMEMAIQLLGMDRITLLVQTHAAFCLAPRDLPRKVTRHWWRHNLSTALFSQYQARHTAYNHHSYLSGLLHSIGQIALYQAFPATYPLLLTSEASDGHNLLRAERKAFNTDHCELGAALLERWHLPDHLIDAAQFHHSPDQAHAPSTHHIHSSCCLSNALGCSVFSDSSAYTDTMPDEARNLLANIDLCDQVALTVKSLESQLFPSN